MEVAFGTKSEIVEISTLKNDPDNAREHSKKNLKAIKDSLKRFGQQKPIVVSDDNVVLAGNGTLAAAIELGWKEIEIKRSALSGTDATAYSIADNRASDLSSWNSTALTKTLKNLENIKFDLSKIGFETKDFNKLVKTELKEAAGNQLYTKKIEAPHYEPKGTKPAIYELFDLDKRNELLRGIEKSSIDEEVKKFLRVAAERHSVFNYELIAEYYAHSPKEVQELFEKSALVIIDLDKAIENGFVSMSEDLAGAYKDEK